MSTLSTAGAVTSTDMERAATNLKATRIPIVVITAGTPLDRFLHSAQSDKAFFSRAATAGPLSTAPSTPNREPWQGQSQVRSSVFQCTMQPR